MKHKIAIGINILAIFIIILLTTLDGIPTDNTQKIVAHLVVLLLSVLNLNFVFNRFKNPHKTTENEKKFLTGFNILFFIFVVYTIKEDGLPSNWFELLILFIFLLQPIINLSVLGAWQWVIKMIIPLQQRISENTKLSNFITEAKIIIKNNKVLVAAIIFAIFSIYFWGIRPSQIRQECSRVTSPYYGMRNATDSEYKSCLRKNGIADDKILTPQEVRKDKETCYRWYGKEKCDNPNFNPE